MGGTAFGDVGASLFRSKRSIGEISVEKPEREMLSFSHENASPNWTSKLDNPAGAR